MPSCTFRLTCIYTNLILLNMSVSNLRNPFWVHSSSLTLLLQLQLSALPSIHVVDAAVHIDSGAIVDALAFLPQLDHTGWGVSVCVRVEVVPAVCFIDGDVQVGQVELDDGFRVSTRHADALHTFPHHCALWLLQKDRGICGFQYKRVVGSVMIAALQLFLVLFPKKRVKKVLTLNGDVEGAAGPSMLVLSQAAVLSVSLRCDPCDLQHRQLVSGDGAHQLPVLQPGEGWGRVSLGATVQGQGLPLLDNHGIIYQGLPWRIYKI